MCCSRKSSTVKHVRAWSANQFVARRLSIPKSSRHLHHSKSPCHIAHFGCKVPCYSVYFYTIAEKLPQSFPNANIQLYTVPTISLPDAQGERRYIMNSKTIAEALELAYPDPSLQLDSPVSKRMTELQVRIWDVVEPIILTHVHKRLLSEVNYEYWRETREVWLNPHADTDGAGREWKTLEDVEAELRADGGAMMGNAWKKAGVFVDEIASLLKDDFAGPFLGGKDVSFADFQWVGFLLFVRRIGEDQWNMMRAGAGDFGPHEDLLAVVKDWIVRDDF